MAGYFASRLAQIAVVFVVFVSMVFFLVQAQPGDFATFYTLNPDITPEARDALRDQFGLNEPMWKQYLIYVGNVLQGDFGQSFGLRRPVTDVIMERFPRTAVLFLTATVVSFYLGFVLGKIIAWRRGGWTEYIATVSGVYLYTSFTPWLALLLMWLFAFRLEWLPLGKFVDPVLWRNADMDANGVFNRLILTALIGSILIFAGILLTKRYRLRHGGWVMVGLTAGVTGISIAAWASTALGPYAWDILKHMVLPVLTLTLVSFAGTMLLTRTSMLEVLREDYVLAARAKGLPDRVVRDRHVARNAMLPVATSLIFSLAFAIDGGVINESIFSWPGLGLTLLDAATTSDLPLAVGAFAFTGFFALAAHLVADILNAYLDPRLRT